MQVTPYVGLLIVLAGLGAQSSGMAARLSSQDFDTRRAAAIELEKAVDSNPSVLDTPGLDEAIVTTLERENTLVAANFSQFASSRQSQLHEGYSEHYARVLGVALRLLERRSPATTRDESRLIRALVFGAYGPESDFTKALAIVGEPIVPAVLELSRVNHEPGRWNANGLIVQLFAAHQANGLTQPLTPLSMSDLRVAARAGLSDPQAGVRQWAVRAVMQARDREAIPLLQVLATTDPDVDRGAVPNSVRSLAAEALRRLK